MKCSGAGNFEDDDGPAKADLMPDATAWDDFAQGKSTLQPDKSRSGRRGGGAILWGLIDFIIDLWP
jgi:hypothetical protein